MLTWLQSMQPWYDQPVTTTDTDPNLIWNVDFVDAANSWQADWVRESGLEQPPSQSTAARTRDRAGERRGHGSTPAPDAQAR